MAGIDKTAITWRWWLAALAVAGICLGILLAMHRPPISADGTIRLWYGSVNGPGNSQHIADWYTLSHIIHGMLFFGGLYMVARRLPLGARLVLAVMIEGGWEILENSPFIIDRYRAVTLGYGYSGDSILNSMCDIIWMSLGFLIAARLRWQYTVALAILLELIALVAIRDNLTLNILMLVYPLEAVRIWQAG